MKKILAILLSLALVICMLPASAVTAFAAGTTDSPEDLSACTIMVADATYTGAEITPDVTVRSADGTVTYTKGVDYTVSWDETIKSVKDYTVTIAAGQSGTSRLTSTADINKTFKVNPRDLGVGVSITAKTSFSDVTKVQESDFKVMCGDADITADCIVTIQDVTATAAGKWPTVLVTAKAAKANVSGQYADRFEAKIDLTDATVTCTSTNLIYNRKVQKPSFKVVVGSRTLTEGTDYTLDYSAVDANAAAIATIKSAGKYTGTTTGTYTIKPKAFTSSDVVVTIPPIKVNGTFNISVYDKATGQTLKKGTDYTLAEPTSFPTAGKSYSVNVFGNGNYDNTTYQKITYIVVDEQNLLKDSNVKLSNDRSPYYTGSDIKADVTVTTDKGQSLRENTDYKIAYYNTDDLNKAVTPKNPGTYRVYVQGYGNYAVESSDTRGILAGTLMVKGIEMEYVEVRFGAKSYDSTLKTYIPSVELRAYTGATIPKTDYTVDYYLFNYSSSSVKPYVIIKPVAKGSYAKGQTSVSLGTLVKGSLSSSKTEIMQTYDGTTDTVDTKGYSATISKAYYTKGGSKYDLTIKSDSVEYAGYPIEVEAIVYDNNGKRLDSYKYDITYKDSKGNVVKKMEDPDTYKVIISGYNPSFSITKNFTVKGNDISGYTVKLNKTSENATGANVTLPVVVSVTKGIARLATTDYSVSYKDANDTTITRISAPGIYKVVVTGKNGYSGTTYATFRVIGLAQSITGVKSSYKMYPNSNTLQLTPSATEGSFTYTSSDSSIASVSSTGVVTAYKAGRAKITIKTTGNTKYDPATISTVIKVYPKKAVMTRKPWTTAKKGQIKVRWNKQDNVTRYEVRYSRAKNFAKGTYITKKVNAAQNDYTTQSTTISKLKSGYKYYVKVRAVKEVYNDNGKMITYYGTWSNWRSVVVK